MQSIHEISSSFDVSADDFRGLIVSIPNDIPLPYDKESNAYSGQDKMEFYAPAFLKRHGRIYVLHIVMNVD